MTTIAITLFGGFSVTVASTEVDPSCWSRRHAAALVKVLALAPGRRMHREELIDQLWPDDAIDEALPKLHKAAHYARKAIDVTDALVLRGEQVTLCPDHDVRVDAIEFQDLWRRALATGSVALAREALAIYAGDLLPQDRYDEWAETRREQLRLRRLDLLRLEGRWDQIVEIDPGDEVATVNLMRRYANDGDRHAAIRQFERLDRHLRRDLGVSPGRDAVALRDRLIAGGEQPASPRDDRPLGRPSEIVALESAVLEAGRGNSQTVIISGPEGIGKSLLLTVVVDQARAAGFRVGSGTSAPVEGAWPYAPVVEALADLCRRHPTLLDGLADQHRDEISRALSGAEVEWNGGSSHQRLFVAAAELVRLAAATNGLILTIDDVHDADDASLRLIHFLARSTCDEKLCIVLTHRPTPMREALLETRRSLIERHGAIEIVLGPLGAADIALLVERVIADPSAELLEQIMAIGGGVPFAVNELARRAAREPGWAMALDTQVIAGIPAATRDVLQRVAVVGLSFDTDEFVALSGSPEAVAFDHLDLALTAGLVEPASNRYRFRHGLVRDALLGDLPRIAGC